MWVSISFNPHDNPVRSVVIPFVQTHLRLKAVSDLSETDKLVCQFGMRARVSLTTKATFSATKLHITREGGLPLCQVLLTVSF